MIVLCYFIILKMKDIATETSIAISLPSEYISQIHQLTVSSLLDYNVSISPVACIKIIIRWLLASQTSVRTLGLLVSMELVQYP